MICDLGFIGGADVGDSCQCRRLRRLRFNLWIGRIPWSRKWQPTPLFFPGESQGQRSLEDYNPWSHKELDVTKRVSTHGMRSRWISLPMLTGQQCLICEIYFSGECA